MLKKTNLKNYLQRFIEYFDLAKIKYVILKDTIWYEYQKSIIPLGPAKYDYSLSADEVTSLLKKFSKSFLIRSTNGFSDSEELGSTEWYAVIKDKHLDINLLDSYEGRKKVRRGLQNCKVERVDAEFIANNAYKIFISAYSRYKGISVPKITNQEFAKQYIQRKSFDDIFNYWGVFSNDKLIGYSENLIYDMVEVNYSTMKFNPEHFNLYPSYALVYTMDKYYLDTCKYGYVNDGYRSILHNTNIQEFLIKNLNFKKKYTKLNIHYKKVLSLALSTIFPILPLRNHLIKISPRLNALFILEEIRRKCT